MSEILIRSRRCKSGVLFDKTYVSYHWETGKVKRMRKLESEDLPFVTACSKLREITDCIGICLKWSMTVLRQVCYDTGLLSGKQ